MRSNTLVTRSIAVCATAIVMALSLAGCSSKSDDSQPPIKDGDCDPIVPDHCGFPFPSNIYLKDDDTGMNPSGKSVRFGENTLPKTLGQYPFDPANFYGSDGFSPGQAAMMYFPGGTDTGMATPDTIASTVSADSPTILLDTSTGDLVPHWVDLDYSSKNEDERAFMIRPAIRLKDQTRYIVAIRHVVDADGNELPPSPEFKALRDGTASRHTSVNERRDLYKDIFSQLQAAGVDKKDLQIAWDYTTASKENNTRWMVAARDKALALVGDQGPEFTLKADGVEEAPNAHTLRRITVTMHVPLFLTDGDVGQEQYKAGHTPARLVLGDDGLPVQNGMMDQDVLIIVPNSVTDGKPHGILQNGHGLFGSRTEGENGYMAEMTDDYDWIGCATNYFGFSGDDVSLAINALGARPELFSTFFDRQVQGQINQLMVMRMMMGRIAKDGIKDASGNVLLDPAWIDPKLRAYRGDSQGGIMGTAYVAISTDVTRGLVGEPGMPYNLLLNRSQDWPAYGFILTGSYSNYLDQQIVLGLMQMGWDRAEPDGFAPYMSDNMLPNTPAHHILIHDGLGDHQVSTYAAHIIARSVGAVNLKSNDPNQPLIRDVYGVEGADAPVQDQNAMVEYDFALAKEPLHNIAATDGCDPHDRVRVLTPSYEQSNEFFRTGKIDWFCNGVCNCDGPNPEDGCDKTCQ